MARKVVDAMRDLPVPDPGTPDHRSAMRYLWWLVRRQWRTVAVGIVAGIGWMVSQALIPAVLGVAIQQGVSERDARALLTWSGALVGLGVVQAVSGVIRHRCAVFNYLAAGYRTIQVTVRQ